MAVHLQIDKQLLAKALEMDGHRTKKATVTEALEEYIRYREQMKAIESFGTIDYDPEHKAEV